VVKAHSSKLIQFVANVQHSGLFSMDRVAHYHMPKSVVHIKEISTCHVNFRSSSRMVDTEPLWGFKVADKEIYGLLIPGRIR